MEHEEGEVDDFSDFDDDPEPAKKIDTKSESKETSKLSKRKGKRRHADRDGRSSSKGRKFKSKKNAQSDQDDCSFDHDFVPDKKPDVCRYFLTSSCTKGKNCVYHHETFPCKYFHTGKLCKSGDSCRFSHAPLTLEFDQMLKNYLALEQFDLFAYTLISVTFGALHTAYSQVVIHMYHPDSRMNMPAFGRPMMAPVSPHRMRMALPPHGPLQRHPIPYPRTLGPPHGFSRPPPPADVDYRLGHQPSGQLPPPFYGMDGPPMRPPYYPPRHYPPRVPFESYENQIDKMAALISRPSKPEDPRQMNDPRLAASKAKEKFIVPSGPLYGGLPKNPMSWRLDELDLGHKLTYCQMDLPREGANLDEDIPSDPRLKTRPSIFTGGDIPPLPSLKSPEESAEPETPIVESLTSQRVDEEAPRSELKRPMKLKLNEMASTAEEASKSASAIGDRSYLADPRFKRKKIVFQPAT
ncbi:Zinc finger CCCH domain-containing protein 6 [Cichlidogyrus casuarinus]|uniref:Zinc finger CCCH domain-containing protein 6 n=1 Tax=Cichlidogyrus casuarinus TaxID=1844966 RepID=A0ABD2QIN4_9PLAT